MFNNSLNLRSEILHRKCICLSLKPSIIDALATSNMDKTLNMRPRDLPQLLKEAASEWIEDGAMRLSASLAYYAIFSLAPLLVIVISIAGVVFG